MPEAKRSGVVSELDYLSDKYRKNKFIVSCRTAVYSYFFEDFTEVEMAHFAEDSIRSFVYSWFNSNQADAAACWAELCAQPNIMELASVPLLLTMICLAYQETHMLSNNRADLYRDAIDALLKKWDIKRDIPRDEPYKQLTFRRKEDLFNVIAATTFERDQFFMREEYVTGMIEDYLERLPDRLSETISEEVPLRTLPLVC